MSLTIEIIIESKHSNSTIQTTIETAANLTSVELNIQNKEIAILICDNNKIHQLNKDFRNKDKPTNVLSFEGEGNYLGDIAISLEYLLEEIKAENKTLKSHLSHMVIHGILHLLGYDHETDSEAQIMESLEEKILSYL